MPSSKHGQHCNRSSVGNLPHTPPYLGTRTHFQSYRKRASRNRPICFTIVPEVEEFPASKHSGRHLSFCHFRKRVSFRFQLLTFHPIPRLPFLLPCPWNIILCARHSFLVRREGAFEIRLLHFPFQVLFSVHNLLDCWCIYFHEINCPIRI